MATMQMVVSKTSVAFAVMLETGHIVVKGGLSFDRIGS